MKVKSLVLGAALVAFYSGTALAGGCGGGHSMAKMSLKETTVAQSTKISEMKSIELAAVPTDAWLLKYLA